MAGPLLPPSGRWRNFLQVIQSRIYKIPRKKLLGYPIEHIYLHDQHGYSWGVCYVEFTEKSQVSRSMIKYGDCDKGRHINSKSIWWVELSFWIKRGKSEILEKIFRNSLFKKSVLC